METIALAVLVAAFVLFVLAGLGTGGKYNLTAFGLACLTLSVWLLPRFK